MEYEVARIAEIRKYLNRQVDNFVEKNYDAKKSTIIFIPGSPGSKLDRSVSSFTPPQNTYKYASAWISLGLIPLRIFKQEGLAHALRIDPDGRDAEGHIIVPDGTLGFIQNNYGKAKRVLKKKHNYFEFGFDFRRQAHESASWLNYVIQRINRISIEKHGQKLSNLVILCHSFGGVVGRLSLKLFPEIDTFLSKFITVGTPFFGSPNHFNFIYNGDPKINKFYSSHTIASIYSSFSGPYPSMYLPYPLFEKFRDVLNIHKYPVIDRVSGKAADPYSAACYSRFPHYVKTATRQKYGHIKSSLAIQYEISEEMPENICKKTFHFLSDQVEMPSHYVWDDIDGDKYHATGQNSPVQPAGHKCPGDGSVHHWAACLPQVIRDSGPSRIHKCAAFSSHYKLMQSDEILHSVQHVIARGALPGRSYPEVWQGDLVSPMPGFDSAI